MKMTWELLQKAFQPLKDEGIQGVLIGTAALWAHGYNIEPHDIDFLVEKVPQSLIKKLKLETPNEQDSVSWSHDIDGCQVHYVEVNGSQRTPKVLPGAAARLNGVPMASVDYVIDLKRSVGRIKDINFLEGWDVAKSRAKAEFMAGFNAAQRRP